MDYDVIIVGSGPAGASTALHLARRAPDLARRTLMLERDHHPRRKLCGGGCVPDVDVCLQRLGLDFAEVSHIDARWANLNFRGRGFRMRFDEVAFHVVRRDEFDSWLAHKARDQGIGLQEGTIVRSLRPVDGGIEVDTNRGAFRGRVVVGADGANSIVRRTIARGGPSHVARLVELFTPAEPPGGAAPLPEGEAVFEFAWAPEGVQGYAWSFPMQRDGRAMRNWGVYDGRIVPAPSAGSLRRVIAEFLKQTGYQVDDYRLEGHPIRLYDAAGPFSAPHVLLAGDAAGVDAVFGEGISPALGYGELAAAAIHDAFARQDFSLATYGDLVRRSDLGRALQRRARTASIIYRLSQPRMQKLMWWRMGRVIEWYLKRYVFNWAQAGEGSERSGAGREPAKESRSGAWLRGPHWLRRSRRAAERHDAP